MPRKHRINYSVCCCLELRKRPKFPKDPQATIGECSRFGVGLLIWVEALGRAAKPIRWVHAIRVSSSTALPEGTNHYT